MEHEFVVGGQSHRVSVEHRDGKDHIAVDGEPFDVDLRQVDSHTVSLLLGSRSFVVHISRDASRTLAVVGGHRFCLEEPAAESARAAAGAGSADGEIKAPMPGLVTKVHVAQGAVVKAGESLVVVEAMKMENEMRAPFRGVVAKVHVQAGQQVDAFQALVEVEPAEGD
ncbi:MAG: biotin/lipoyl-containing protein [Acidobacteriota bacterium]